MKKIKEEKSNRILIISVCVSKSKTVLTFFFNVYISFDYNDRKIQLISWPFLTFFQDLMLFFPYDVISLLFLNDIN